LLFRLLRYEWLVAFVSAGSTFLARCSLCWRSLLCVFLARHGFSCPSEFSVLSPLPGREVRCPGVHLFSDRYATKIRIVALARLDRLGFFFSPRRGSGPLCWPSSFMIFRGLLVFSSSGLLLICTSPLWLGCLIRVFDLVKRVHRFFSTPAVRSLVFLRVLIFQPCVCSRRFFSPADFHVHLMAFAGCNWIFLLSSFRI